MARDDESRCKMWEVVKGANKLRRARRDARSLPWSFGTECRPLKGAIYCPRKPVQLVKY